MNVNKISTEYKEIKVKEKDLESSEIVMLLLIESIQELTRAIRESSR